MRSYAPTPMIQDVCLIRPLHSLGHSDVQAVKASLARLECSWPVEHHDDYDGDLLVLISIQDPTADGASFLLRGMAAGVELIDVAKDSYTSLGVFSVPEEAILHLHGLRS